MSVVAGPATPETERRDADSAALDARIRRIAIDVVVAASRAQAGHAAGRAIDRYRLKPSEVEEFLSGGEFPDV